MMDRGSVLSGAVLEAAPHLWQVGLVDQGERYCDTLVIPVDVDLSEALEQLGRAWPDLVMVPGEGYAHLTLDMVEGAGAWLPHTGGLLPAVWPADEQWRITGIVATPYSVRAVVDGDLESLAALFGVARREAYITLAYATDGMVLGGIDAVGEAVAALELAGYMNTVEHRRVDGECGPFEHWIVNRWDVRDV